MKHHWKGLTPCPNKYFGFVYRIDQLSTGMFYIGKKQFWESNGKVKRTSLRPNRTEGVWNEKHWRESKWHYYTGSSIDLNKCIKKDPKDFKYTMIGQFCCKADLVYSECKAQMDHDVLTVRGEDGELLSYNRQIASVKFIPPLLQMEQLERK